MMLGILLNICEPTILSKKRPIGRSNVTAKTNGSMMQVPGQILEICQLIMNKFTPPKFNMEPENDGFQREFSFLGTSF